VYLSPPSRESSSNDRSIDRFPVSNGHYDARSSASVVTYARSTQGRTQFDRERERVCVVVVVVVVVVECIRVFVRVCVSV